MTAALRESSSAMIAHRAAIRSRTRSRLRRTCAALLAAVFVLTTPCDKLLEPQASAGRGPRPRTGDFIVDVVSLTAPHTIVSGDTVFVVLREADPSDCSYAGHMWMLEATVFRIVPYGVRAPTGRCRIPVIAAWTSRVALPVAAPIGASPDGVSADRHVGQQGIAAITSP